MCQQHDELFVSVRKRKPTNDGKWITRSNLPAMAGRMDGYTGEIISYEQFLSSIEVIFPEGISLNPKYDVLIEKPDITKFK